MKLISLNTWGARAGHEKFLEFFDRNQHIDIFCLQEVWNFTPENAEAARRSVEGAIAGGVVLENMMVDLFSQVAARLPSHQGIFHPCYGKHYGLAMFIHKRLHIEASGDIFVYKTRDYKPTGDVGDHARNIQYTILQTACGLRLIVNFHGLWNGKGKSDCPERLEQSHNIKTVFAKTALPIVFCGDFNLLPNSESLRILEAGNWRNLITKFGIASTRTSFYPADKPNRHADYILISPGIETFEFKVLPDEISDHAPLYYDFD